jgi:signal transduction histidine kinase/ligand-binding sensor domain-containing protein/CheY-like chemotaxis protein
MRLFGYVISFLLSSSIAFAQMPALEPVSDIETLSGIQVNDIKQDSLGFLWVATNEGLYRYDGYNLKLYEPNAYAIGSSIVRKIYFDKGGDMWAATRGGLLQFNKRRGQFSILKHNPKDSTSIHSNSINDIVEDNGGNLWLALSKGGIDRYNKKEKKFYHYLISDNTGLLSNDISALHFDSEKNLWASTWNDGVNKLDLKIPSNKIPKQAKFEAFDKVPRGVTAQFVYEDTLTHDLYVGTADHGLLRLDKKSKKFNRLTVAGIEKSPLYGIVPFQDHKVWILTGHGVRILNMDNLTLEDCDHPICYYQATVYSVFKDNQNVTWMGSGAGLKKYVKRKVNHFKINETTQISPANNVITLCKQGQYLWLGTWGGGLYIKDELTDKIARVNEGNPMLESIWDLKLVDNKYLLVATGRGIVRLNVDEVSVRPTFEEFNFEEKIRAIALTKNESGDTWVGTWTQGLYRINVEKGEMTKYEKYSTESHFVQSIYLDKKSQLWIGTVHAGLIKLANIDGKVSSKVYLQDSSGLSSDFVSVIFEDKDERLWIGTGDGGVNILDLRTEEITWIMKGDRNLPSNTVRAIVQDNNNDIWISFKSGISKLDKNGVFINYSIEDGFENMEFNPNSVLKFEDMLYFGNYSGFNRFNPSDLIFQKDPPKVYITDFRIFDKSILPGEMYEGRKVLEGPINEQENVRLSYKIKNITFEFSALNFVNPKREIFAYKLEPFNEDWIYTNASNRQVSYSNLEPGDYVFKVKTSRNDDVTPTQGRMLKLHIIPPFWQTTWFIVLAGIVSITLLYLTHWVRLARLRAQKLKFENLANERVKVIEVKNHQLELKNIEIQKQAEQLHEADQSKINFFANISHEFRTPLMLIVGPIAKLIEGNEPPENESLVMIHRNAKRLLRLIDQIMDFTKMEAGSLTLDRQEGDFIKFIKETAASFNYLAKVKRITYEFYSTEESCFFYFDHDKVEKIVYNLLSNAFKVTPPAGRISITLEMLHSNADNFFSDFRIEIFNSGKGIPAEEQANLFTRFYRTKSYTDGTGIGLSLTKSLVELQGGSIEVSSEENQGTWFCVTIPLGKGSVYEQNAGAGEMSTNGKFLLQPDIQPLQVNRENTISVGVGNPNAKTVLVLDDDEDMRFFIARLLQPVYNVHEASNGEEALKLAYQFQPDVIISDMMMPVMDGYQFLKAVKGDSNISHIPIILLTARASMDARLKGLEEGADDYITKPFNEKILLLRVKNLIDRMQQAREKFSTDINLEPKEITITSLDEKFIQDLLEVVEKNMSNPEFGADTICQELGVGRSYLYAKVKALTNLPVNEFVKTIRLKRAAVLLIKSQLHVNEVAYQVGFNDRYYFSRCFLKHFGTSPIQYQKDHASSPTDSAIGNFKDLSKN